MEINKGIYLTRVLPTTERPKSPLGKRVMQTVAKFQGETFKDLALLIRLIRVIVVHEGTRTPRRYSIKDVMRIRLQSCFR